MGKNSKIIAVANQKGGTGKTTTAAALLQAAVSCKKKALAIDLDPQANLTYILGADASKGTAIDLLHGTPIEETVQGTAQGIDIIPAAWDLQNEQTFEGSALRLQNALAELPPKYDLIVIDTPATAGELQYNAFQVATDLIIPLQADILGVQGLYQVYLTAEMFTEESNTALKGHIGIIFEMSNSRTSIAKQMQQIIEDKAKELDLNILGEIPKGVAIQESQAMQKSLFDYAPNSKPAAAYMALYKKIIKK